MFGVCYKTATTADIQKQVRTPAEGKRLPSILTSNRLRRYLSVFLAIVMLRAADLYIAWRLSPDLAAEWNPLVSQLKMSWAGLLGVQCLLIALAVVAWQRYETRQRLPVTEPGLGLMRFVYYYFNGRDFTARSWTADIFRLPDRQRLKVRGAFIGFVLTISFVLVSLFAVTHNLLILTQVGSYIDFIVTHHSTYLVSVFVAIVFVSANLFFVLEFREYLTRVSEYRR